MSRGSDAVRPLARQCSLVTATKPSDKLMEAATAWLRAVIQQLDQGKLNALRSGLTASGCETRIILALRAGKITLEISSDPGEWPVALFREQIASKDAA
jgi:hypothetical protein